MGNSGGIKKTTRRRNKQQSPDTAEEFLVWLSTYANQEELFSEPYKSIAVLSLGINRTNEHKVRLYYRLGNVLRNIPRAKWHNVYNVFNIPPTTVAVLQKIADTFKSEEEAIEVLSTVCNNKLTRFMRYIQYGEVRRSKRQPNTFAEAAKLVLKNYHYLSVEEKEEIGRYIQKLATLFPLREALDDKYFLRYSKCVCCGNTEEYPLTLVSDANIPFAKLPKCSACLSENKEVDMALLAEIYIIYAYNLEAVFHRINDGLGV